MIPLYLIMVLIVNTYRLEPLKVDFKLTQTAQHHAEWMQRTGRFEHSDAPYAEIIYWGEKPFEGWMNSPPHKAILLGPYKYVGFGYAKPYWVGVFR